MPANPVVDYLVRETGRYFPNQIHARLYGITPWPSVTPRGEFPKGLGEIINVLTYEPMAPQVAEQTWQNVLISDGAEGGECLQAAEMVDVGSTTRNFGLKRLILQGPDFCAEESRSPFEIGQQLQKITDILVGYAGITWEIHNRHEYWRMTKYKVVINGNPPYEDNTQLQGWPAVAPTATMDQGILSHYGMLLKRNGAVGMGTENGVPVLTWFTSQEASDNLLFRNPDIRQDLRWGQPSELLKKLGVERSYRGFFHLLDLYPMRYSVTAGPTITEQPVWQKLDATKGKKAELNPPWLTAAAECTFIYEPTVLTQLVPRPITNPAPNFRWSPVNYQGIWALKNIPDRDRNPDENILFHRGIFMAASMPEYPERGVSFLTLRCDFPVSLVINCGS
jgi:hypothetical protein